MSNDKGWVVPRRKVPNKNPSVALRFTPNDIMRAIAGVEAAGLPVYEVEITTTGSIKIGTGPRTEKSADAQSTKGIADPHPELTKKPA